MTKYFNGIISKSYFTPLHLASQNNNIEIVKLLLSMKSIDVNIETIFKTCFNNISNKMFLITFKI